MASTSKINFQRIILTGLARDLSLDETMHLASLAGLFKDIRLDIRSSIVLLLQEKELVTYSKESGRASITPKGKAVFKLETTNNSDLAKQLRELYPAGLKDDKWPWRSTNVQIKDKLDEFKKIYPDATDEQIINATKNYLHKMSNNDNGRSLLCYFILKRTDDGRKSILAEYIDLEEDLKKGPSINPTGNIMQI